MTYKCEVCLKVSKPRQPKLTYNILRPNGDISREVSVCDAHAFSLEEGVPLSQLMRMNAEQRCIRLIKVPKIKPKKLAKALTRPSATRPTSNHPVEVFLGTPIKLKGAALKKK